MSKKRGRETSGVDVKLVEIYEDLAHEDESIRLKAAQALLSAVSGSENSESSQIKVILKRLFRGLCSSRKAARLGFSVALTELLSQLHRSASLKQFDIAASSVIDALESQTQADGSTSGQDERDHFLGRLFGAEAVIKSCILFKLPDTVQWKRLLDLICMLSNKKPWLKQECGWILYNCIKAFTDDSSGGFAVDIVERLNYHKLVRTPEGVAIWIETKRRFPDAKLPKDVWKHRDPFARKDVSALANILRDAKGRSEDDEHESQGKAMWSAQLHFVWDIVLAELGRDSEMTEDHGHKRLSFQEFWLKTVDESLFAESSSPERKYWGFSVFSKTALTIPPNLIENLFSKQLVRCMINSLRGEDRFLKRGVQKGLQAIQRRIADNPEVAPGCLKGLLLATDLTDFDALTKSKTMDQILTGGNQGSQQGIAKVLNTLFIQPGTSESDEAIKRRRNLVNLQSKQFAKLIAQPDAENGGRQVANSTLSSNTSSQILETWIRTVYFEIHDVPFVPSLTAPTRDYVKDRLATCFELVLKTGAPGILLLEQSVNVIRETELVTEEAARLVDFGGDDAVSSLIEQAWHELHALQSSHPRKRTERRLHAKDLKNKASRRAETKEQSDRSTPSARDGLALLLSLTLFQIYNGDPEALEILQELIDHIGSPGGRGGSAAASGSDALVEIVLSFASKPSKFLRRATTQIFEAFTSQITRDGLESLARILATKESIHGQGDVFDTEQDEEGDGSGSDSDSDADDDNKNASPDGSDVEMLDSDVEIVSATSSDGEDSSGGGRSSFGAANGRAPSSDALAALDAQLAAALRTRPSTAADLGRAASDSDSSSDVSSMSDSAMSAVDAKLAEVFRAMKDGRSANQNEKKKRALREARETMVHFKNRVLDLADVFLRREAAARNPLCFLLLLPLLRLARSTSVKQLADRACALVRELAGRCKRVHVPALSSSSRSDADADEDTGAAVDAAEALDVLREVHDEACLEASHAHSAACSSASLLLVKALVRADADAVASVVDVYGTTRVRQLTDRACRVQPAFFTEWNNWCAQAKEQIAC